MHPGPETLKCSWQINSLKAYQGWVVLNGDFCKIDMEWTSNIGSKPDIANIPLSCRWPSICSNNTLKFNGMNPFVSITEYSLVNSW